MKYWQGARGEGHRAQGTGHRAQSTVGNEGVKGRGGERTGKLKLGDWFCNL